MTEPKEETEFPVGLTERGKLVYGGYNALAADGDDTLSAPDEDRPDARDDSSDVEDETGTEDAGPDSEASPSPALTVDVVETADDADADDREIR